MKKLYKNIECCFFVKIVKLTVLIFIIEDSIFVINT